MEKNHSSENLITAQSAWPYVFALPALPIATWAGVATQAQPEPRAWQVIAAAIVTVVCLVCLFGFFVNTPNHSRVLVLFGRYRGTVREPGFYWTNPFTSKRVMVVGRPSVTFAERRM